MAQVGGATVKVLVGSAFGHTSPVATLAPTLYLDVTLPAGQSLTLSDLPPEAAIYPISGEVAIDDVPLEGGKHGLAGARHPARDQRQQRRAVRRHRRRAYRRPALYFMEFCVVQQSPHRPSR